LSVNQAGVDMSDGLISDRVKLRARNIAKYSHASHLTYGLISISGESTVNADRIFFILVMIAALTRQALAMEPDTAPMLPERGVDSQSMPPPEAHDKLQGMTPEERRRYMEQRQENRQEKLGNLSPEDRERLQGMSPEDRWSHIERRQENRQYKTGQAQGRSEGARGGGDFYRPQRQNNHQDRNRGR
jgi:hypothetical protein